jgi:hypothetical protein
MTGWAPLSAAHPALVASATSEREWALVAAAGPHALPAHESATTTWPGALVALARAARALAAEHAAGTWDGVRGRGRRATLTWRVPTATRAAQALGDVLAVRWSGAHRDGVVGPWRADDARARVGEFDDDETEGAGAEGAGAARLGVVRPPGSRARAWPAEACAAVVTMSGVVAVLQTGPLGET